jgi:hypothetical protein
MNQASFNNKCKTKDAPSFNDSLSYCALQLYFSVYHRKTSKDCLLGSLEKTMFPSGTRSKNVNQREYFKREEKNHLNSSLIKH